MKSVEKGFHGLMKALEEVDLSENGQSGDSTVFQRSS